MSDPVVSKLASAQEHLQYVLDHPSNGLDLERIRMAISLIEFERSKQHDEARQKARAERIG
ncbi:MAG TPA: hypothetical protein VKS43_05440 [Burkholderiales bacterium]|nr:hypothetical protein [Burkholderiales bacterium]